MEYVLRDHPELTLPSELHQKYFFAVRGPPPVFEEAPSQRLELESQLSPGGEEWTADEDIEGDEEKGTASGDFDADEEGEVWRILEPTTTQPTGTSLQAPST